MVRSGRPVNSVLLLLVCALACSDHPGGSLNTNPVIEFRFVHDGPGSEVELAKFNGEALYLDSTPLISDGDFLGVRPYIREHQLLLAMELTSEGEMRLRDATRRNIGKRLAMLIDSQVQSAVIVQSALSSPLQAAISLSGVEAIRVAQLIHERWP